MRSLILLLIGIVILLRRRILLLIRIVSRRRSLIPRARVAVGTRYPSAILVVSAFSAGRRSGCRTVGVSRIVCIAWGITVSIRCAVTQVDSAAVISAIARPRVRTRSGIAAAIGIRAGPITPRGYIRMSA